MYSIAVLLNGLGVGFAFSLLFYRFSKKETLEKIYAVITVILIFASSYVIFSIGEACS